MHKTIVKYILAANKKERIKILKKEKNNWMIDYKQLVENHKKEINH